MTGASLIVKDVMNTIWITNCSWRKDTSLKHTNIKVTPDILYTSPRIQRFIQRCRWKNFAWAIFSDYYGVWFADKKHEWYEKHPKTVTEDEYQMLLKNFDDVLMPYEIIYFYYHPARFHGLYKRLLQESELKERITAFTSIRGIG